MYRKSKSFVLIVVMGVFFTACVTTQKEIDSYVVPNYSIEKNWAALPTKKDKADLVPKHSNLLNGQDSAKVDVFFIHYTTYWFTPFCKNAGFGRPLVNGFTNEFTIKYQASVFNGSCKVYAPRYRQASIVSFIKLEKGGEKALDFAYLDVKNAFEYYLKNYNKGRPFIIASHSQGSYHTHKLIKEYIEKDTALYKQLVCAYVVGWANKDVYSNVKNCDSASQTGCLINWQTTRWGTKRNNSFPNKVIFLSSLSCTNPLTWKRDTAYAARDKNLGGAPLFFMKTQPQICDAQIHDNLLWIHRPKKMGYLNFIMHYHLFDYSLFYVNVRENVKLRVDTFLKTYPGN